MIVYENKEAIAKGVQRVRASSYSDFYKKKFHNFQENYIPTLEELPFLSREEMVAVSPDDRLYVPKNDVVFVSVTSGTTSGKPLISFFSRVEDLFFEPSFGMPITRPLIIFPPLNKNFGYSYIQQCCKAQDKVTPVFGDYTNLVNSAFLARETNIDSVFATPTIASMFGKIISRFYDPKMIHLLMLSSETLTITHRNELSKLYPNASIVNIYASAEVGNFILYPCVDIINRGVNEFHFKQNVLDAVELIDGELVITYTLNKAFPLIRYKTGDFFDVAHEQCSCGMPGATLKWSGRMDVDKIRIHGFEITIDKLEETFQSVVPILGKDYQVHFYDDKSKINSIRVVVEVKKRLGSSVQNDSTVMLARTALMERWLITPRMSFSRAVETGVFSSLDIIFVEDYSFKSEKIRRLVSHL